MFGVGNENVTFDTREVEIKKSIEEEEKFKAIVNTFGPNSEIFPPNLENKIDETGIVTKVDNYSPPIFKYSPKKK